MSLLRFSFISLFLIGFTLPAHAGLKELREELIQLKQQYETAIAESGKMSEAAHEARTELIDYHIDNKGFLKSLPYLRDSWAWVEQEGIKGREKGRTRYLLGKSLRVAGYFKESRPLLKKACEKTAEKKGEQSRPAIKRCIDYGITLSQLGRYEEAIAFLKQQSSYSENLFGDEHGRTAYAYMQLGSAYQRASQSKEARKYLRSAFQIYENKKGSAFRLTNLTRFKLAKVFRAQGNYDRAERILRKAYIDFASKKENQDHQLALHLMSYLGRVLKEQGRYVEAEQLLKESIEGKKAVLGVDSDKTIQTMLTLANIYLDQIKAQEAEKVMLEIASVAKNLSDTSHFGLRRNMLWARTLLQLGRLDEAEVAYAKVKSGLDLTNESSGRTLAYYIGLGRVLYRKGEFIKAEPFFSEAVKVAEKIYGKHSLKTSHAKSFSAQNYARMEQFNKAVNIYREVMDSNAGFLANRKTFSSSGRAQQESAAQRHLFSYMKLMVNAQVKGIKVDADPVVESFVIAEASRSKSLQSAMLGQTARAAARNEYLSNLVRREQDVRVQLGSIEEQQIEFVKTALKGGQKQGGKLEEQRNELTRELVKIGEEMSYQYPEYNRLINPAATALPEVQALLTSGELMLAYFVQKDRTLIWAIDKNKATLHVSKLAEKDIHARVQKIRAGLDVPVASVGDIPPYNLKLAHELYGELIAPVGKQLEGIKNLIVVPHKALLSMPFGALLTAKAAVQKNDLPFSEYKNVPWLAKKYAINIMPSATALVTMRTYAKKEKAEEPFVGFGDPLFSDDAEDVSEVKTRGVRIAQRAAFNTRSLNGLPNLPETREELKQIAVSLGSNEENIYLGNKASEENVKATDFKKFRVVAFATHGLVAGDLDGLEQPALALTPPEEASEDNDGLLQMGEVLGLEMNADWVVLSACNTASGDKSLANEGLTGLTQAFFYAGSRALLVSLWPVESTSTQQLTTAMFSAAIKNNQLGRAASLQQARVRLIDGAGYTSGGKELFSYAHPIFWAAFIAVGEGGIN